MADPFLVLGIDSDADDAAVEAAYRSAIKRCPPDRDPAAFQAVREAYEQLRTRRDRIAYRLFETTPPQPIDILRRAQVSRRAAQSTTPSAAKLDGKPSAKPATERASVSDASDMQRPAPERFQALLRGEP
ncbi:MAG: DnaJ domain-containing protein [Lamprobacter sp.]|uniref:DnaJ domain-containing protein n=1 Tax=Lamprobacter sp. TaxID=3100796 RepID=UPI002B261DD1|nr:DnaJ domain-containing protein [Lamprobacter sp.]MEA3641164.1 DnaJ domain-containing protein [Lamprobacter sp.]